MLFRFDGNAVFKVSFLLNIHITNLDCLNKVCILKAVPAYERCLESVETDLVPPAFQIAKPPGYKAYILFNCET